MQIALTGYRHSIYTRIARMALHAKGVAFTEVEVNPFAPPLPQDYPHPFGRVPILAHGDFTLFETAAITRYVDLALPGLPLVPTEPKAAARMTQVIAIADAYAFRPLVLEVYAQRVFRPAEGLVPDESKIAAGVGEAIPVLAALETLAAEGAVLNRRQVTLADCHLAPMLAAFAAAPEGRDCLAVHAALQGWFDWIAQRPAFIASGRDLPMIGAH